MRRNVSPYQRSLALQVIVREPTAEDLRAAYEVCVSDKESMPFQKALTIRALEIGIRNTARAAIIRRGGR